MWYKQIGSPDWETTSTLWKLQLSRGQNYSEHGMQVRKPNSIYKVQRQVTKTLRVSWCCGNHCLFAFVLWCGCCSLTFQNFVWRHLVTAPICKTKKSPKLCTVYESFLFQSQKKRSGVAFTNAQHKKSNKMIPCIHLHICNAKRFKPPKSLKDENNSTSLLKQHANIISLNKARLHRLSLHCYKTFHLVETLSHLTCTDLHFHGDIPSEHLCGNLRTRIPALAGLIVGTEMVEW